jgi:FAD/FMN-containing dehydrogenase
MKIQSISGNVIELQQEKLDNFKMKIRGQVLIPGDAGFEDSRSVWNAMIKGKPAMIVRCLGTADVIACVQFANENNILLCIKGGGHNIAGLAIADGGMMLDMSLMRGVFVDREKKIAYTQAGCLLGDVDRETQLHGLAAVLGFVSQTGTAGLTLGGGFGYLTRRWGWTADNVVSMDVVTADGKLVQASMDINEDLFWGLRGGGGNFGIVTAINYKLYPVGPEITGGLVVWPASETEKILELYRTVSENAPEELTLVAILRPAPPAPWIPKEWHGKPIIALLACYSGSPENSSEILSPLKSFGEPIADILVPRPYAQMQALLDTANPKGRRYYWKSEYLPGIEDELNKKLIYHAGQISSPFNSLILFQIGGALNRLQDGYSPVGNRDAKYVLNIAAAWEKAEDDNDQIQWARDAWNDMKIFSTGGTYLNFLTQEEGPERTHAALGKAMERLAEIKGKWDPENFFRINRNIQPAEKNTR